MKKFLFGVFISTFMIGCENEKKEDNSSATATSSETKKSGDEILPLAEGDWVKTSLAAFAKGDVEGMTANYEDTVFFLWSNLDSTRGKKAVQDFFKSRWALLDSVTYSDFIILPINTVVQQSAFAPTGKWTLAWFFTHAKYKTGKKLDFWIHNVFHHTSSGKVDFVGQYMDMAPIYAASKK